MRHTLLTLLTLLCIGTSTLAAQAPPDPCTGAASSPTDASLALSLRDTQTVFREGQIIGLSLAFSSTAADKYALNTRNYDRSGRLNAETFCIEPGAGRDPLEAYFLSGVRGFIGGGIGGSQTLTAVPVKVEIELNEWRSLVPGRYRLRLVSTRVNRRASPAEPGFGTVNARLWSNPIEFEVVAATAQWQDEMYSAALTALDSGASEDTKKQGARALRFLGSEKATRELARRFWSLNDQPFGWEFMFGLVGSPYRQVAIEAMKAGITNPSHPITRDFIESLTLLEIETQPEYRLPPYSDAIQAAYRALVERKTEIHRQTVERYTAQLGEALAVKTGTALAVSINTLITILTTGTTAAGASPERTNLQQMLLASWDALPARTRNELIAYRWNDIKGPGMLPILRRIVATPPSVPPSPDRIDRGPALTRLYELSPSEGRELILREILDTKGDIGMQVLGRLPDPELPEIEQTLVAKLVNGDGGYIAFQLIDRYASARPLADMKRLYERSPGRWACDPQSAMLRYFLRVDRPYGVAQVKDALAQRQSTGCYRLLLTDLRESVALPELELLAIAALDDPSAEVARYAAEALGRYGSSAAENALWLRLEKFHAVWKDRTDELRTGPGILNTPPENMLEYSLRNALTQGAAWSLSAEKIERLDALLTPWRQTEIRSLLDSWRQGQFALFMNWSADGRFSYNLSSYSGESIDQLTRRLLQFPAGSRVTFTISPGAEEQHRNEIQLVRQAAQTAGVALEPAR